MAQKENKGGELTNKQLEEDLHVKGAEKQPGSYRGMQDTGDENIRALGTDVQQRDGRAPEDVPEAEK